MIQARACKGSWFREKNMAFNEIPSTKGKTMSKTKKSLITLIALTALSSIASLLYVKKYNSLMNG